MNYQITNEQKEALTKAANSFGLSYAELESACLKMRNSVKELTPTLSDFAKAIRSAKADKKFPISKCNSNTRQYKRS